jgi:5-formyltetrahydrofolate cyclo-ligase
MPPPEKDALRKTHLARRQSITPTVHAAGSLACIKNLLRLIDALQKPSHVIAGYLPVKGEISVTGALVSLAASRHVIVLPRVIPKQKELLFHRWSEGDELTSDIYGIPTPREGQDEITPDILIVPLLAFDRGGHRLGYGAGYYDITLAVLRRRKSVTAIGAAFALQEEAGLPKEPHDEPLDIIVTENEIITPHASGPS